MTQRRIGEVVAGERTIALDLGVVRITTLSHYLRGYEYGRIYGSVDLSPDQAERVKTRKQRAQSDDNAAAVCTCKGVCAQRGH